MICFPPPLPLTSLQVILVGVFRPNEGDQKGPMQVQGTIDSMVLLLPVAGFPKDFCVPQQKTTGAVKGALSQSPNRSFSTCFCPSLFGA